jgi:hypothetical protein
MLSATRSDPPCARKGSGMDSAAIIAEMHALLVESQTCIGSDWRQRRDAVVEAWLSEHAQPQEQDDGPCICLIGDLCEKHARERMQPAQEPTDGERLRCAHCGAPRWIHGRSDYWCPEFKPAMSARTEGQGK